MKHKRAHVIPTLALTAILYPSSLAQEMESLEDSVITAETAETDPAENYLGADTSSSARLALSILETPQTVSSITELRIEEQSLRSVDAVIGQAPGITARVFDTTRPVFYARGFTVENFTVDSIPIFFDSTWGNGEHLASSAIYEQVEVVKGASGLLNGVGNPSASVNLIRKRATATELEGSISAGIGTFDQYNTSLDIGTALNENGTIRLRGVFDYFQEGSEIDIESTESSLFYLTAEADLGMNTLLTIGGSHQTRVAEGFMWGSLPAFFNDGTQTSFSRTATTGVDWANTDTTRTNYFVELDHKFNDDWKIKAKANYDEWESDFRALFIFGSLDEATGFGLFPSVGPFDSSSENLSLDLFVDGKFNLFGREHELVLGTSYSQRDYKNAAIEAVGGGTEIGNFFEYDGTSFASPTFNSANEVFVYDDSTEKRYNQYVTARINPADNVKVLLGANITSFEVENQGFTTQDFDAEIIPFLGVVYNINNNISAYASYTSIFDPQAEEDINGDRLDPIEGNSFEIGVKGGFMDDKLIASAAYYNIGQDNLAQATGEFIGGDVSQPAYAGAEGASSQGIELELTGSITDNLNVQIGYAFNEIEDADGNELNTFLPKHLVKAYLSYNVPQVKGLTVGAGVTWNSDSFQDFPQASGETFTFEQDSFLIVDAFAKYQVNESLSVQLNIDNVFDELYSNTNGAFDQYLYGPSRSGLLTVKYDF